MRLRPKIPINRTERPLYYMYRDVTPLLSKLSFLSQNTFVTLFDEARQYADAVS